MTEASPPSKAKAWVMASRPPTLTAALAPVAVGCAAAAAEGGFSAGPAAAAAFGAMAIQVGTNFANDVFDYEKGADTEERLGPTRAVQAGLLSPTEMRWGMFVAFALATAAGVYLTMVAGWVVVAIGVLSIASGIAYTAGPYPLAYLGLGDVFVMLFFGFVAVMGTSYVQTGTWSVLAAWASVPVGSLCTAILVVNNYRDRHQDVKANKRTLAVRFGGGFARAQYVVLMVLAYAVPVGLFLTELAGPRVMLPMATLPIAFRLVTAMGQKEGAELNPVLARTAQLLLIHSLLFSVGLIV